MTGSDATDSERTAVYAAELAAFDGTDLEDVVGVDRLRSIASRVTAGEWWPAGPIEVRPARRDSSTSSARCSPAGTTVRIASEQATRATLAHELAHCLVGPGRGHDAVFRRAYLDLVAVVTNIDSADRRHDLHVCQLEQAFRDAGLTVGERAWPEPAHAGPIVL